MWEPGPDRSLESLDGASSSPASSVVLREVLCKWGLPTEVSSPVPAAPPAQDGLKLPSSPDELVGSMYQAAPALAANAVGVTYSANGGAAYGV